MSDATAIYTMKERLLEEMAEVMLAALRKEGGVALTANEYYTLKERLMDALTGSITV